MEKNFEILDLITLKSSDMEWDLHNEFEISSIKYDSETLRLKMTWLKVWPTPNKEDGLTLIFEAVDFINLHIDVGSVNGSDKSLSFAGYLPDDQRFTSDSCYEKEDVNSAMIFSFEDGSFATVRSGRATAQQLS
jgi:hypothetical protein